MQFESLTARLQHVAFLLARQADQILLEQLGLGFSQYKIMLIASHKPGVLQKQIAEGLGQTEASISRQVKLLRGQGLLTIARNPTNQRQHQTHLTARGERLVQQSTIILQRYQAPVLDELGGRGKKQLQELLTRMHKLLCHTSLPSVCD